MAITQYEIKAICRGIAPGVKDLIAQATAPLIARLEALEAQPRGMEYRGVFESGKAYSPGDVVTRQGSMWHCNQLTSSVPGAVDATPGAWTLCVKKGSDAH